MIRTRYRFGFEVLAHDVPADETIVVVIADNAPERVARDGDAVWPTWCDRLFEDPALLPLEAVDSVGLEGGDPEVRPVAREPHRGGGKGRESGRAPRWSRASDSCARTIPRSGRGLPAADGENRAAGMAKFCFVIHPLSFEDVIRYEPGAQ